jgi:hypothetical protein
MRKISLHKLFLFFLLKYLNEPNYENVIAIQIGIMEQTINVIDKVSLKDMDHYNPSSCESFPHDNNVLIMNSDRTRAFTGFQEVIRSS